MQSLETRPNTFSTEDTCITICPCLKSSYFGENNRTCYNIRFSFYLLTFFLCGGAPAMFYRAFDGTSQAKSALLRASLINVLCDCIFFADKCAYNKFLRITFLHFYTCTVHRHVHSKEGIHVLLILN